jgi:tRNA nucleotidyltransferase (CCA-adding enzyme)
MKIIIGHTTSDFDSLGSMVLAGKLYPDYHPVRSSLIHPAARGLYNLYSNHLKMLRPVDIKGQEIESVVMVDTGSMKRVKEFFPEGFPRDIPVIIYDHHDKDSKDFPEADVRGRECGANTTLLVLECMEKGVIVDEKEATVALAGIYADTGNFLHTSTTPFDLRAASWLLEQGGSIEIVKRFQVPLKEAYQVDIFHSALKHLSYHEINGHFIITGSLDLEEQVGGLAAVVEKVFEIEYPDALFFMFYFQQSGHSLIVARSQKEMVDVSDILTSFGGGGHAGAASALVKNSGREISGALIEYLHERLVPAIVASDIMSEEVLAIPSNWTLLEASLYFEQINHTGAPVLDEEGGLSGFLSLRDIMKGRKANAMHSPVTAYMRRPVITCGPGDTIRQIEQLMFDNAIGHLPVVRDGTILGIVTRGDYLKWIRSRGLHHPSLSGSSLQSG